MANRALGADLGQDVQIVGQPDPRSAVLVSVVERGQRRSVLVVGERVVPVDFEAYLGATSIDTIRHASRLNSHRVSTVLVWALSIAAVFVSILAYSGIAQVRVILTDSMTPGIKPGDVVVGLAPTYKQPIIGDVVLYEATKFDGTAVATFAHRIVGGSAQAGFIVKGDANANADIERPGLDKIQGVVLFVIPYLGLLLTPQNLSLLALTWLAIWLVRDGLRQDSDA